MSVHLVCYATAQPPLQDLVSAIGNWQSSATIAATGRTIYPRDALDASGEHQGQDGNLPAPLLAIY